MPHIIVFTRLQRISLLFGSKCKWEWEHYPLPVRKAKQRLIWVKPAPGSTSEACEAGRQPGGAAAGCSGSASSPQEEALLNYLLYRIAFVSAGENICLIDPFRPKSGDPFWRFMARFLACLNKLKSFCWQFLRCVSGAGEWGARGARARPGVAERLFFWAAAIRFSLNICLVDPFSNNTSFPIRFCPK
jgi:hypothetical protein